LKFAGLNAYRSLVKAPAEQADPLPPDLLLNAYAQGIFPMAMEHGEIGWFTPDPRGIIPLDERFHIPHGLKRTLKKAPFEIRFDTAFREVMQACAERETTWINGPIIASYTRLFTLGFGHSVEAWQDGQLVGGLYGVSIGGVFCGESMFSRKTDASKVALVALVERLRASGFKLLDTQWTTPHLETFGAYEISRVEYLSRLRRAIDLDVRF
jgi:leucyl/phenylalanyl-tRNA---protein transferase